MPSAKKEARITESSVLDLQRIGETLSLARRLRGLSQSAMARHSGMGLSTLVSIENGNANVAMLHWVSLMEALDLSSGLAYLGRLEADPVAMEALTSLAPKRASRKSRIA